MIKVFDERPPLDPAVVYDATAMQAELVAKYASIGARAVQRSAKPRWVDWVYEADDRNHGVAVRFD